MSPWERIVERYDRSEDAELLAAQLDQNLQHGFVFSTPDFFIMGREVEGSWFIEAMAGDMSAAWGILPYDLPTITFRRFDNNLRSYPLSVVKRLTHHEMARHLTG